MLMFPKPWKSKSRKKRRIAELWTESEVFLEIWNERLHKCEDCWRNINEPHAHNFDHEIPKSRWEEFRYDKNNIKIRCFPCHFLKTTWLIYKWPNLD